MLAGLQRQSLGGVGGAALPSLEVVKSIDVVVQLVCQRRRFMGVGDDFDVGGTLALARAGQGLVEFTESSDPLGEPSFAPQCVGKFGVVPRRDVVISNVGVLTQQPLDEITGVVEHEDDWAQTEAMELADLLCGQLMGTLAGDEHHPTVRGGDGCAECRRSGPPIDPHSVWL